MIAQRAFEHVLARQLSNRGSVSLRLATLRAKGWDVEMFLELAHEYIALAPGVRRFVVEIQLEPDDSVIVVTRNVRVAA